MPLQAIRRRSVVAPATMTRMQKPMIRQNRAVTVVEFSPLVPVVLILAVLSAVVLVLLLRRS